MPLPRGGVCRYRGGVYATPDQRWEEIVANDSIFKSERSLTFWIELATGPIKSRHFSPHSCTNCCPSSTMWEAPVAAAVVGGNATVGWLSIC